MQGKPFRNNFDGHFNGEDREENLRQSSVVLAGDENLEAVYIICNGRNSIET